MEGLLYLARADVERLLPGLDEQLGLVEATYRAMARGRVEMPPKPGIHPRPNGFIHAMPAYVGDGIDVAAIKWIAAYRANKERGLGYLNGLIVLNDAETGLPLAVMDAAEITAARTADASGVCIRAWAPEGWATAAIVGFGVQGVRHAAVLRGLNPDARLRIYDPRPERATGLEGDVVLCGDVREAVAGADVVVTTAPMVDEPSPSIVADWLSSRCLVLPVDFDASVRPEVVAGADLFLVDDVPQFEYYRGQGSFPGWPEPHGAVGTHLDAGTLAGRVVCANLGVGALDAAFAKAVVDEALRHDVGTWLPR